MTWHAGVTTSYVLCSSHVFLATIAGTQAKTFAILSKDAIEKKSENKIMAIEKLFALKANALWLRGITFSINIVLLLHPIFFTSASFFFLLPTFFFFTSPTFFFHFQLLFLLPTFSFYFQLFFLLPPFFYFNFFCFHLIFSLPTFFLVLTFFSLPGFFLL